MTYVKYPINESENYIRETLFFHSVFNRCFDMIFVKGMENANKRVFWAYKIFHVLITFFRTKLLGVNQVISSNLGRMVFLSFFKDYGLKWEINLIN